MAFTMCSQPVWTKCRHQPHLHDWPLSVMEGKWSDGWLLAASSQMAAGTALCLADNQRTSKLRQALRPISVQSQEAKGTGQRKETATDKDWGSQKSQQAWKWAALALSFPFACFFVQYLPSDSFSHTFIIHFSSSYSASYHFSLFLCMLCEFHYSITVKAVLMTHSHASKKWRWNVMVTVTDYRQQRFSQASVFPVKNQFHCTIN